MRPLALFVSTVEVFYIACNQFTLYCLGRAMAAHPQVFRRPSNVPSDSPIQQPVHVVVLLVQSFVLPGAVLLAWSKLTGDTLFPKLPWLTVTAGATLSVVIIDLAVYFLYVYWKHPLEDVSVLDEMGILVGVYLLRSKERSFLDVVNQMRNQRLEKRYIESELRKRGYIPL